MRGIFGTVPSTFNNLNVDINNPVKRSVAGSENTYVGKNDDQDNPFAFGYSVLTDLSLVLQQIANALYGI